MDAMVENEDDFTTFDDPGHEFFADLRVFINAVLESPPCGNFIQYQSGWLDRHPMVIVLQIPEHDVNKHVCGNGNRNKNSKTGRDMHVPRR